MASTLVDPVLTAMQDQQQANFRSYAEHFVPYQLALREILNTRGIVGILAVQYEAFNGELYSAHRRARGPYFDAVSTVLVNKYIGLGLDEDTLAAIVRDLYESIAEPVAPVLLTPPDAAPAEPIAGNLTWNAALRASGYDVYLYKTIDPPAMVSSDQPGLLYAYAGLSNLTNYSWYIIGRNDAGPGPKSPTWTFTTV